MRRSLEAIFRRPIQLLAVFILLPLIGLGVAYFTPKTYQCTATIWALHRFTIIGLTGGESDLNSTPAQTQATAMTELLNSTSFALSVAHSTDLVGALNLNTSSMTQQQVDDALSNELKQHVQIQAVGYNLLSISYTSSSATVAQAIVANVITNYGIQSQNISLDEGKTLIDSLQTKLATAKQNANAAATQEAQYLQANPNINKNSDPQYLSLHLQTLQAQNTVSSLQSNIDTVNQEIAALGSGPDSLYRIVDAPVVPTQSVSRSKYYLTDGGIGLGVALLAIILYVVITVRRDRAIYTAIDMKNLGTAPVVIQIPTLSAKVIPHAMLTAPTRRF